MTAFLLDDAVLAPLLECLEEYERTRTLVILRRCNKRLHRAISLQLVNSTILCFDPKKTYASRQYLIRQSRGPPIAKVTFVSRPGPTVTDPNIITDKLSGRWVLRNPGSADEELIATRLFSESTLLWAQPGGDNEHFFELAIWRRKNVLFYARADRCLSS